MEQQGKRAVFATKIALAVCVVVILLAAAVPVLAAEAGTPGKKPNIVFIMGDDIGMWNIGAYHRGMMAGRTPHIDKLASEGAIFTDYYAEASCTAGRANFITGELPIRTGLTTVGQAGAKIGIPAAAVTIATALKELGYATGQFGKNHLGDRNEFLPTAMGSTNSSAISITLTPWRTPGTRIIPRTCWTRSARAMCCTALRPTKTIRRSIPAGARWANRGSLTRVHSRPIRPRASS